MTNSLPGDADFDRPAGGGTNAIRDADAALFPDGRSLIHIFMKARLNPVVKPQADHILSMSIRRGRLDSALNINGKAMNAAEALYLADAINSYGANGESRDELLEAFGSLPTMERRGGRGGYSDSSGGLT